MIKILKYGEVDNKDIFARAVPAVDVEAVVAEIISNVKANGGKTAVLQNCSLELIESWLCMELSGVFGGNL